MQKILAVSQKLVNPLLYLSSHFLFGIPFWNSVFSWKNPTQIVCFSYFVIFSAAFDEKKPNQMEAKTDRKPGQHPADDRDSDDEMEAVDKKEKKPVFKSIVNEIAERYIWINHE